MDNQRMGFDAHALDRQRVESHAVGSIDHNYEDLYIFFFIDKVALYSYEKVIQHKSLSLVSPSKIPEPFYFFFLLKMRLQR